MKFFTSLLLCLLALQLHAQVVTITDDDLEGGNTYNWTNDNTYLLDGFVVLEAGGVLNIEAGTVIKGKFVPTAPFSTASALVIARGARIHAEGTAAEPVIFTSELDDVNDEADVTFSDRGLWGGVTILGDAPIAEDSTSVAFLSLEGIDGAPFYYGGENEADSSGVLRYVSIRHPGASAFPDEEMDGLFLGGVGSKTIISNIEVYAGQDDAITMSGGAVNLKYLSVSFNSDESIDWDLGWRGKGQFWLALQDEESNRCGEHDGASPDLAEPFSKPVVSNVTYIGPGSDVANSASEALLFRDRTGGVYTNSIFTHFPEHAINVEDRTDIADSYDHLATGNLLLNCNYWWDFGAGSTWSELVNIDPSYEDQSATLLINLLENTQNTIADPMLVNLNPDPEVFDPRLSPGSPALNAGCALDDPFFDPVNYVGAFDSETIWLNEWTGMDANLFFAFITSTDAVAKAPDLKLYPNPARNFLTVEGLSPTANLRVLSLDGRVLLEQPTRDHTHTLDIRNLPEGIYLLQVQSAEGMYAKKFVK